MDEQQGRIFEILKNLECFISYSLLCDKLPQNIGVFKEQTLSHSCVDQEFGSSLHWWYWLESLMGL